MTKIDMEKVIAVSEPDPNWKFGFISAQDVHCFVTCDCGEEFSVSDYKIVLCKNCGKGYITQFSCYRIPKDKIKELEET